MSEVTLLTAADLPRGLTLLEASAGTGKTHTIAGLVTRFVAEGVRLPRVLVVTFTRAATAELRDRVRRRLVDAVAHLEAVAAGAPADGTPGAPADEVLRLLAAGSAAQRRQRLRNLETALAEFDAATVATIHGFCQQVLGGIGLAGDVDRAATLLEDQRELVEAVVDDLLVRTYHAPAETHGAPGSDGSDGTDAPVSRRDLVEIARAVVANAGATIVPVGDGDGTLPASAARRVALAHQVRTEVDRRKRALGLLSYDDVLTRLAAALRDPEHGDIARRRLRAKYDVVLIDEFQDTDPVQWDIVSDAFADGGRTLVLIGDPKQAIYAFRGADVHAYLAAARRAGAPATLTRNWRSDGPLLQAFNALFDRATLGHVDIPYRSVFPRPGHERPRLRGAPDPTPLRIRVVRRDAGVRVQGRKGETAALVAPSAREHVARDLAAEVVGLLGSGAGLVERDPAGSQIGRPVPVRPEHLAVLVRTNAEATLVQRSLREAGVPAVINGVGSVFATVGAGDWLRLLAALEQPTSRGPAAAAALTPFVDWTAEQLADGDDDAWDALHERLQRWAALLRNRGVAALARTISSEEGLPGRLLGRVGGERLLTDLDHVAELLHAAAAADQLGVAALVSWLRQQLAEAEEDLNPEERSRRLESDADAVQVLTVHRSKGLEFPIVYAPFMWSCNTQSTAVPVLHRDQGRIVDVGGAASGPEHAERRAEAKAARRGEDLRLLYVALTRARHQAVVWWAPTSNGKESPLGRVLFCRNAQGVGTEAVPSLPSDDDAMTRIGRIAADSRGTISVEPSASHPCLPRWGGEAWEDVELSAARFDRHLDRRWRRASYTSLTRAAHDAAHPAVGGDDATAPDAGRSELGQGVTDDELLVAAPGGAHAPAAPPGPVAGAGARRPLEVLPGGVDTGTFVHGVLERTDFAAADLDAALHAAVAAQLQRGGGPQAALEGDGLGAVVHGLRLAIETPLGSCTGGRALRDFARGDRLDELAFELPLAAASGAPFSVAAVAGLLRQHLAADDPLAGYAERLGGAGFRQAVRGFLTGSLDLVLRAPADGTSRYLIADYKTNVLGPRGAPLSPSAYGTDGLVEAMGRGHYPLQALLYLVALHRYLRWRQPGYDPERHVGGVLYLFVRGMTGAHAPADGVTPRGVFAWRPPTALLLALDELIDAGEAMA